jgi:serine phosphatase RsbU (regulator of sigma subunit)
MAVTNPRLVVRDASGNEREIEVSRLPFRIGRQSDNDLVLLDARISRHHACITRADDAYRLEDLGSRHGTFVNGQKVTSCALSSGDQISLGVVDAYQMFFLTEQVAIPKLLEEFGRATAGPAPQLQHLALLLRMAQMLHRAPVLEEVLTTLLDSAVQLGDAERGVLYLRDAAGEVRPRLARGRGGVNLPLTEDDVARGVVERVALSGREEVTLQEEFSGRATQETAIIQGGMRGVVALPLQKLPVMESIGDTLHRAEPELLGVLYLENRSRPSALTGLDRQVLQSLALEGATVIENARLLRVAREEERFRHELSLARNIQRSLLPRELPQAEHFELRAVSVSSQAVGGDYFDAIRLPGGRFGFAVADVSGKGLPAAMMAGSLQGAFGAVAAGDPELGELVCRVNEFLCERTPPEMFATLFYGVLDPRGHFDSVNAGHTAPLVVRAGGVVERLSGENFPMGFFPGIVFRPERIVLNPGDCVVMYSDGVTEAQDAEDELFGEQRLKASLESAPADSAQAVCDRVLAAVEEFVGSAPQADDVTLMVLRYSGLSL